MIKTIAMNTKMLSNYKNKMVDTKCAYIFSSSISRLVY